MSQTTAESVAPLGLARGGDDESRYILTSRIEIVHVLRDLVRTRALANVQMGGGQETLLSPLLAVDTAAGEVIFDRCGSDALNQSVLRARNLLFVSAQDKIKIRFFTPPARVLVRDGGEAFAAPLPTELLRLQRREAYRLQVPVVRPVLCIFALDADKGQRYVETRIHDIGQEGVAVIAQPDEICVDVGTCYANCRIVLPEAGNVVVTMEIRHSRDITLANGKKLLRIGCQFVRPSMAALNLVHRYMMKIERERRARE
jgi:c-di-GMP-binding flagellar brake protein YcgR